MKKKILGNVLLLFISVSICLIISEFIYRALLFGNTGLSKKLKEPGLYANPDNESDYWKLYYLFGGEYKPPKQPHPLLGWVGDFEKNTLMHNQVKWQGNKRPVLLYGDSYAQCVAESRCFQDILNQDSTFTKEHFFINYGVGGYGVDQIALLFKNTVHHYKNPFVVFSLMVGDLDRTHLDWRTGQKPYFIIDNSQLKLQGVPVDSNPDNYIKNHPVNIKSYLWRRFLYSKSNVLPDNLVSSLKHESEFIDKKIKLNGAILNEVVKELRSNNMDFVFLIFHYFQPDNQEFSVENENNWRDEFLKSYLEKNKIPYIWSKELVRKDATYNGKNIDKYMIASNGHPTTYFNEIISEKIKEKVLENSAYQNYDIPYFVNKIKNDEKWFAYVKNKSLDNYNTIEQQLEFDADFVIEKYHSENNHYKGYKFYEHKIREDSLWLGDIKNKALKNKIDLNYQTYLDAKFMEDEELKNHSSKSSEVFFADVIYAQTEKIKQDSSFVKKIKMKNQGTNTSIDEAILNESFFKTIQDLGVLYKFNW